MAMTMRWYVVHAYSGFEQQVHEDCSRSASSPQRHAGRASATSWCRTEEVVEMRDGQRRKSDRKFFPGYVLVNMEMNDETWHSREERAEGHGVHRRQQ